MSVQIIFRKDKFREYLKIFREFYLFFQCQEIKNRDWGGEKLGFILEIGHFQL